MTPAENPSPQALQRHEQLLSQQCPFEGELGSLEKLVGNAYGAVDINATDQDLHDEQENLKKKSPRTLSDTFRYYELKWRRASIQRRAYSRIDDTLISNEQSQTRYEYFPRVIRELLLIMKKYTELRVRAGVVPVATEDGTSKDFTKEEKKARGYFLALHQAIDSFLKLDFDCDTTALASSEQKIADLLSGVPGDKPEEIFLPQTLYSNLLEARYRQLVIEEKALVERLGYRNLWEALKGKHSEVERLNTERHSILQEEIESVKNALSIDF